MTPTESTKKITCKDGECKVTELFQPMHKYSRTGFDGKLIKCPHCETTHRVYHLAWVAGTCPGCKQMIDKYDWMIENELE
jgi:hypothetical protein